MQDEDNRHPFEKRPGYCTIGKAAKVAINQFRVLKVGGIDVSQYDVAISPVPHRPILYEKVWDSPACQRELAKHKGTWIYDRRKLAWSAHKVKEIRMMVNIDEARGREANDKNTFHVILRNTGTIRLQALRAYLSGQMDFDTSVLECMSMYLSLLKLGEQQLTSLQTFWITLFASILNVT
jgi:eukaryotic translation initiation factor 2C